LLFVGCFYFGVENNHSQDQEPLCWKETTVPNKQKVTKGGQQGQKPTLYSVAELVLGFKTAGILHQPFPPADNTQIVE
jgi:hypothetical protein